MSKKLTGKFTCPVCVAVNITKLNDKLSDIIATLISEAIQNQQDTDGDTDIEWEDFDRICINTSYNGSYSYIHYPGNREEPPKDDIQYHTDNIKIPELQSYIKDHIKEQIQPLLNDISELIEVTDCEEFTDDITYEPDEPDWDSMPGGHDYD